MSECVSETQLVFFLDEVDKVEIIFLSRIIAFGRFLMAEI